jgi:hypothetical protein
MFARIVKSHFQTKLLLRLFRTPTCSILQKMMFEKNSFRMERQHQSSSNTACSYDSFTCCTMSIPGPVMAAKQLKAVATAHVTLRKFTVTQRTNDVYKHCSCQTWIERLMSATLYHHLRHHPLHWAVEAEAFTPLGKRDIHSYSRQYQRHLQSRKPKFNNLIEII